MDGRACGDDWLTFAELTVDGRACGDDWLTFAELAAGGALAYCTGTTPDTGWAAGPAAAPPAYCAG